MNNAFDIARPQQDFAAFRLLDLPIEIQESIIQAYYGSWGFEADYDYEGIQFKMHNGNSGSALILTCHHIYKLASRIRSDSFNGIINLRRIPGFMWYVRGSSVSTTLKAWSGRIHTVLDAATGHYGPNTPRLLLPFWEQFPNLKRVEIRFSTIIFDADATSLSALGYSDTELLSGAADQSIGSRIMNHPEHWESFKRQLDRENIDLIAVLEWRWHQLSNTPGVVKNSRDVFVSSHARRYFADDIGDSDTSFSTKSVRTLIKNEEAIVISRTLERPGVWSYRYNAVSET